MLEHFEAVFCCSLSWLKSSFFRLVQDELETSVDDDKDAQEDAMGLEAATVLREWTEIWHELYLMRDQSKFNQLKRLMEQLLDLRRQLVSGHLTSQQRAELRLRMVDKINLGTRLLDMDIVAREPDGNAVDIKRSSAVHLFNRVRISKSRLRGNLLKSCFNNLLFIEVLFQIK